MSLVTLVNSVLLLETMCHVLECVVVQYICDGGQSVMVKLYERLTAQRKGATVPQVRVCVCSGVFIVTMCTAVCR